MKSAVEKIRPSGIVDYLSLAITTVGVGYLPLAPGTWGSMVGVGVYVLAAWFEMGAVQQAAFHWALNSILLAVVCFAGIWASDRAIPLLGNSDPSEAVIDEVMGQLITFAFVPLTLNWHLILPGFILFRLFDIWKPYPIRSMEVLPGGLGICADDIVAGAFAGICLAVYYAIYTIFV